jgi:hypothetical protein
MVSLGRREEGREGGDEEEPGRGVPSSLGGGGRRRRRQEGRSVAWTNCLSWRGVYRAESGEHNINASRP